MSKRKPHNMRARLERTCRALVSANHAAVVNIDPSGQQVLINWKNLKQICIRQIGRASDLHSPDRRRGLRHPAPLDHLPQRALPD